MSRRERPTGPRLREAEVDKVRERVLAILEDLPEARAVPIGGHLGLEVRKRRFGWLLVDHHGDGRLAVNCKASPAGRAALTKQVPRVVFVPKYVGHQGWIGLWLDVTGVEWSWVRAALFDAYRLAAPKSLAARLGS